MTDDEVLNTFKTAAHCGSGFEQQIGRAGILASADNKALILRTWPQIYQQFGPGSALHKTDLFQSEC